MCCDPWLGIGYSYSWKGCLNKEFKYYYSYGILKCCGEMSVRGVLPPGSLPWICSERVPARLVSDLPLIRLHLTRAQ